VFEWQNLNYIYIFNIDPANRKSSIEIVRHASFLSALWCFSFTIYLCDIRTSLAHAYHEYVAMGTLLLFFILFIHPLKWQRTARYTILKVLWNIIISPFGKVEFRHFYLADVICSLAKPLGDLYKAGCFIYIDIWIAKTSETIIPHCENEDIALVIIACIPSWFRFAQCLNKYNETKQAFPHLVNAAKYASGVLIVVLSYFPMFKTPDYIWIW
jgi:hypothetical protein